MKKNVMMRVASALLVAVLLSTCAISGTFAKYVTAESGTDQARVAKWGVDITVDSFKLFKTDYEKTESGFSGTYTVSSANDGNRENLLAPGTEGTFADIKITGTPEVAVDVKVEATVAISDNWKVDDAYYCPLVVTVGGTPIEGISCSSAADFAAKIEAAIEAYSAQYEPNKDLTEITNGTNFDISWAWAIETGADAAAKEANNKKDTKLGAKAVAEDLTFKVDLAITVTQIN